jgi:hypothetical protein
MLSRIAAIKPYLFQSLRNSLIRRIRRQSIFSDIRDGRTQAGNESSEIVAQHFR